MRTWTLASSHGTRSPFIQIHSDFSTVSSCGRPPRGPPVAAITESMPECADAAKAASGCERLDHRVGHLVGSDLDLLRHSRRRRRLRRRRQVGGPQPALQEPNRPPPRSPSPPRPGRDRGEASSPPTGRSPAGWRCPRRRCRAPIRARARTGPGRCRRGSPREHPERAGQHRRLVAEDVAEHVLGQQDVEMGRVRHELHRRVVDQHVVQLDLAVLARPRASPSPAKAVTSRARWPCRPR